MEVVIPYLEDKHSIFGGNHSLLGRIIAYRVQNQKKKILIIGYIMVIDVLFVTIKCTQFYLEHYKYEYKYE